MGGQAILFWSLLTTPAMAADRDGDGFDEAVDCDDTDAGVSPAGDEGVVVDGLDQDCSGLADDVTVCPYGGSFTDLQTAIDTATAGFTLVLCEGVWEVSAIVSGKELGILGAGVGATVLQGDGVGTVLGVDSGGMVSVAELTVTGAGTSGVRCVDSSLGLQDVDISENSGVSGAGLHGNNCNVDIRESTFSENESTEHGGGLNLFNSRGVLDGNVIENNTAVSGGGAHIVNGAVDVLNNDFLNNDATTEAEYDGGGGLLYQSDSHVRGNLFQGNHSNRDGGGFYGRYSDGDWTDNVIDDNTCTFDGAGGYFEVVDAYFSDNLVSGNSASDDAGGLRVYRSDIVVEDNVFRDNSASDDGGGLKLSHSVNTVRRNDFIRNSAGDAGGGLEFDNESSDLANCRFYQNVAGRGGGLHYWRTEGEVVLQQLQFVENTATSCGAAIQVDNAAYSVTVRTTLFKDNFSEDDGGAVCVDLHYQDDEATIFEESNFVITNSLFWGNSAVDDGGVAYVNTGRLTLGNVIVDSAEAEDGFITADNGHAVLVNGIVRGVRGDRMLYAKNEGTIEVSYTDLWDNEGTIDGMEDPTGLDGNISVDPQFRRRYRLAPSSECIDAGDPSITDKDGSRSDMGARGGPFAP